MTYRAKLIRYFVQRDRGWVLSLFVAVCVVYLPFIGNPFFFDDLSFFPTGVAEAYSSSSFPGLRWLPYASLGRLYTAFSAELSHVYHLANIALHAANSILLFYLLRRLMAAARGGVEQAGDVRGAWFGALIFALHPVAAFAAGYVIQISILMATLFSLLMLLAYLRGLSSGQGRWFALAVLAYFLACYSKEHAVLMPAVLAAVHLLAGGETRVKRSVLWLTWPAFLAIAMLVTMQARGVFGSPYEPMAAQLFAQQGIGESMPMLHLLSALTQAGLFFKYLLLWVLPDPATMSIDMRESFIVFAESWRSWLGGVAFLLYGAVAIWLILQRGARGLAGFAMIYPWLLFWVEMAGIRMQEPFVLYRSYLWMPGVMLFVPLLLSKVTERKAVLVIGGVAVVLAVLSWGRLSVFSDNYRLWNEAAALLKSERTPGADRIFFNRGQAEMAQNKWDMAAADFKRSADISPRIEAVRFSLGVAYANSGRPQEALTEFDAALALDPNDDRVYFYKGMTLKLLGRESEAMKMIEQSCKLKNKIACLIIEAQHEGKR